MIFNPQNFKKTEGTFVLPATASAVANPCMNKDILKEYWYNFSFECSALELTATDELVFAVGNAPKLPLNGCAYSVNVTPDGICIFAETEQDLLHGYMTLLDQIKAIDVDDQTAASIECCEFAERALIQNRMVHFCIFPETELFELQRFVRLCGALKYTHVVLEFWGMLQYDCMKELCWSHAFTKEQVRPIIKEAHDMGLEVIPMFNHWGHASLSRGNKGKHTVLDQNPKLQTYFNETGWCWDIKKPKVRALLRHIREELCELCGEGKYFHVGCDEAYGFQFTTENMDAICSFLGEISRDMNEKGRRIIAWHDMFLSKHPEFNPDNHYTCNNPSLEAEQYMLAQLDRNIVIADWHYQAPITPVQSSAIFKNEGFDTLLCPWDRGLAQTKAAIATTKEFELMGFMHTTWHTLSGGMCFVTLTAMGGFENIDEAKHSIHFKLTTAALLRKIMPINGDCRKAGWCKAQIDNV